MGSAEQNKGLVRRYFDEVCNGRNLEVADAIFSTDHRYHDPQLKVPNGPRGIKEGVGLYQQVFNDARWDLQELIVSADGNTVTVRWTGSGMQTGELMGIAPTRKRVSVSGLYVFRFTGNRISETWNNWDTLGMLQQLGVVPASVGTTH
jgi:ketosteroid isomerase-like protein